MSKDIKYKCATQEKINRTTIAGTIMNVKIGRSANERISLNAGCRKLEIGLRMNKHSLVAQLVKTILEPYHNIVKSNDIYTCSPGTQ